MTSDELVELLYVAYNRDEAEVFGVDKAIRSGYEELYTTAPDVLDKKMKILDQEIEKEALELINEKIIQVKTKKQQEIEKKQEDFSELINRRAEEILRQNAAFLGIETSKEAIQMIKEEAEQGNVKNQKAEIETKQNTRKRTTTARTKVNSEVLTVKSEEYKGGDSNVGEEAKPKKRGRKPKVSAT